MIESDQHHDELSALEREAHAWIRRLTSGEARASDAAALRRWCGQSPAHAAAFSEASRFWKAFGPAGQSLLADSRTTGRRAPAGGRTAITSRRAIIGGALAATAAGIMVLHPPLDLWPSLFELRADYRTGVGEQREVAMAKRLDRLSRQFERLERDQHILIETVALYVRYYLTVSTPVPEAHQEAARAQGKLRFSQFVEQLGRHLQRGRSLVRDIHEEVQAEAQVSGERP